MDAAKATTVKSVSVFTKETARRVLKLNLKKLCSVVK
jgi:hypothetical protein